MRDNYGIEIMEPNTIESFNKSAIPKKPVLGTPWYSVLSNPSYAEDFCYVGAHVEEREMYIKDDDDNDDNNCEQSDIVMILLNLSSIPD